MADEPPDERRRVPFDVSHPHLKEFTVFLPELNKETDRGMALIATSFIDELLKRILLAFFLEGETSKSLVEGFNAPLGTFSTRIAAAAALALISETECREANYLRKIRNLFAHNVHVSFRDKHVVDMCRNLGMAAKDYGNVVVDFRGQFSTSAVALILNLTNRPHYVSKHRRQFTGCPLNDMSIISSTERGHHVNHRSVHWIIRFTRAV